MTKLDAGAKPRLLDVALRLRFKNVLLPQLTDKSFAL